MPPVDDLSWYKIVLFVVKSNMDINQAIKFD